MDDRYLKTGIFLAPFHPLGENPLLCLERDMDLLVHLDRLNYSEAWVGEHHSGGFEIIACPEMFIAAAAERTRHIRLGTGVVSLPYHNPFTVAGRMLQLDYMTRGRAMFGVGPGSLVYDAVKMGLRPEDQRRKLDELLDVIIELLQGRMVTKKTDWFDLVEARLQLKAYSQPMMEMAVASSRSPTGALAAGKHGIGMLSIGGTSDDALKAHASNWGVYEDSARANGKTADRRKWRIVTFAHVAETRELARQEVKFGLDDFRRYFSEVATFPIIPADVTGDPADYLVEFGPSLHRYARGLCASLRALMEGLERRLRRRPAARAQLGRLAGDKKELRADGALCPSALPAQRQRTARLELRRCQGKIRHRRRAKQGRRAGRDRQIPGAQGMSAAGAGSRICLWVAPPIAASTVRPLVVAACLFRPWRAEGQSRSASRRAARAAPSASTGWKLAGVCNRASAASAICSGVAVAKSMRLPAR